MKKQRILSAAAAAVICLSLAPAKVQADEDYSDTSYWTKQCTDTSNLNGGMKSSCQAFYNYISSQSDSLNTKLKDIDASVPLFLPISMNIRPRSLTIRIRSMI